MYVYVYLLSLNKILIYKKTSTNSFMFREEIKINPNENPFTNKPFDINNCLN